ncbi:MAG: hypothetical protein GYA21_06450 [Myxococcales bacterium]|nr:hypothetical protein [Myxococcales bacterium]
MSRITAVVVLFVALAGVVAGAHFALFPRLESLQAKEVEGELRLGAQVVQGLEQKAQELLLGKLRELAARPALRELLAQKPADENVREAWLTNLRAEVAAQVALLRDMPIRDLFILDAAGTGLVRNIDLHWTGKPPSEDPAVLEMVRSAQGGQMRAGVVASGSQLLRVAAVPVGNTPPQGILLLQALVDDQSARNFRGKLPLEIEEMDVAVMFGGDGVAGTSLAEEKLEWLHQAAKQPPLSEWLAGKRGEDSLVFSFGPKGRLRAAAIAAIAAEAAEPACHSLIVIRDLDALRRPFAELLLWTGAAAGAAWIALSLLLLVFGGRFFRASAALEREALSVLHGEKAAVTPRGPALIRSLAEIFNQVREMAPTTAKPPASDAPAAVETPPDQVPTETAEAVKTSSGEPLPTEPAAPAEPPTETHEVPGEEPRQGEAPAPEEAAAAVAEVPASGERDESAAPQAGAREDVAEEDEAEDEKTREVAAFSMAMPPPPPPPAAQPESAPAEEDDDMKAVYQEFVKAKESLGERVEKLNYERFRRKLLREREGLVAKHGCRTVNFEVVIRGGQVSLRPRIVR